MKILVGVDLGDPALEALRQARTLAHGTGASVAACHVLPAVHDLSALFPQWSLDGLADATADDASARSAVIEHVRNRLGLELTEVFVEHGSAYAAIVRRAESEAADLVVVGSHARSGLARVVLGSVAERVAQHAHCSVLVARASTKAGVVLAATDLSDQSLLAVAAGAAAAKRSGAKLVVVSAFEWTEPVSTAAAGLIGALPAVPPAALREQVKQGLQATLEQVMLRVGAVGEARVLDGAPAPAIVAAIDELGAELVVVGSHGRTGLARLALGSVAQDVIRDAHCSVLLVRGAASAVLGSG
jgi:nucleotide-binding universal stress UspA family protein